MIGLVVAAHGDLAQAFVSTAEMVVQQHGAVVPVGFGREDAPSTYEDRLRSAVNELSEQGGVLILTDMFGGTPSNVAMTMHESGKVEVLTGANLAMLIKALQLGNKDVPLAEAARKVKEYGAQAIAVASEVLAVSAPSEEEAWKA